tara:strand:+ start:504 stop:959 length:456 start_codon:yes stop_codon:yes gene_type:complete
MLQTSLIHHSQGAPGLRLLGLGPGLMPSKGLEKLEDLLEEHAFWAKNRKRGELKKMLLNSSEVISIWNEKRMVGFGRATSDKIYRAVLWDVVIANDLQGLGLGKLLIKALINAPSIKCVEKIYLMTTNCKSFYSQMGFEVSTNQKLLFLKK